MAAKVHEANDLMVSFLSGCRSMKLLAHHEQGKQDIRREDQEQRLNYLEQLESNITAEILSMQTHRPCKLYGAGHLSSNRVVMANVIKMHCWDRPFRLAWLEMFHLLGGTLTRSATLT